MLSLEQFIRNVQFSFKDLARSDDLESSVLRQKYLLHFFYKYISRLVYIIYIYMYMYTYLNGLMKLYVIYS